MATDPTILAAQFDAEIRTLPVRNAKTAQAVRRKYSRMLRDAPATGVLDLGQAIVHTHGQRLLGCEMVRFHRGAFEQVGEDELEEFGRGIRDWG